MLKNSGKRCFSGTGALARQLLMWCSERGCTTLQRPREPDIFPLCVLLTEYTPSTSKNILERFYTTVFSTCKSVPTSKWNLLEDHFMLWSVCYSAIFEVWFLIRSYFMVNCCNPTQDLAVKSALTASIRCNVLKDYEIGTYTHQDSAENSVNLFYFIMVWPKDSWRIDHLLGSMTTTIQHVLIRFRISIQFSESIPIMKVLKQIVISD